MLLVRDADLSAPTPCQGWDVRQLLRHLRGSLAEVTDVLVVREFHGGPGTDPVAAVRDGIVDLLLASTSVPAAGRPGHVLAPPLPVPTTATPGDRLLALFGRRPIGPCSSGP